MRKRPSSRLPTMAWWLICSPHCPSWQPNWSAPDMNIDVRLLPTGGALWAEPPVLARVGVIGAGQMGNGIAHVCALAGLPVTMLDVKPAALERAMGTITHNMDRQVNRKLISEEDKDDALARIRATSDYADLGDADLV